MLHIIKLDELSKAIEIRLDLSEDAAKKYANTVMDLFGYDDRIVDNMLEQRDRQLFYILEAKGILNTAREDVLLHNGRRWRIHYWILKKPTILQYSNHERWMVNRDKNKDAQKFQQDNIYSYLPKNIWASRKT